MVVVSMMDAIRRRRYSMAPWALIYPLYWLLHSVAAYRALWRLVTQPHTWEKSARNHRRMAGEAPPVGRAVERQLSR
jgi:hypothetical protein